MILLIGNKNDENFRKVAEELKNMSLKFKIIHKPQHPLTLKDQDSSSQGLNQIYEKLKHLQQFKDNWYRFQSDACYVDEKGRPE
jgi:hypothetical protein